MYVFDSMPTYVDKIKLEGMFDMLARAIPAILD